jgi:hypothetical protein
VVALAMSSQEAHDRNMGAASPLPLPPPPLERRAATLADIAAGAAASTSMGVVAGLVAGIVWGGIGGRIAMRVLVLTSDERVRGVTSDDGFEIGAISFSTLALLIGAGAAGGFLGSFYGLFRMLLQGPLWLLSAGMFVMVGAAAGGGLVVNADGIDFRLLKPLWLAVVMFVALPAFWGATVSVATERLLDVKFVFPQRLRGVDAKPFGKPGATVAWLIMFALTTFGVIDLLEDLRRLT